MIGLEHPDLVIAPLEPLTRLELDDVDRELGSLDPDAERVEDRSFRRPWTVDRHPLLPIHEAHRSEEADHAEKMVGVVVGEKKLLEGEPDAVLHHLTLGPFAAVK